MQHRFVHWRVSPESVLRTSPVMPVVVVGQAAWAVPLAKALWTAGIGVIEITLRSEAALEAIRLVRTEAPEMLVGAGTVCTASQLRAVEDAGGHFAISPGLTPTLLQAAAQGALPLIPGIATASELMLAMEAGYGHFKCFPAEAIGGPELLRSLAGPFPGARFCPTGGIDRSSMGRYLALPNVDCVGGSWIAPAALLAREDWAAVEAEARATLAAARRWTRTG